ncbi:hypothetical protein DLA27_25210 [Salmonella enterica]|nr:hypothetical protein [Salmonella enterica]EDU1280812.1 hypothetical protein [Salmonella enterica subsp. enterica serovar Saintpaul]
MKKTLIILAVAASAVVSGSAMAWTKNGIGGTVELGGTLTPADVVTPWEVYVGAAVNDLNADIKKGMKFVDVPVNRAIPVLGIRTITSSTFKGHPGISPQIDFRGAIDLNKIRNSEATLTIDVKDAAGSKKIGTLSAPLLVYAEYSYTGPYNGRYVMFASKAGDGFFGGLPLSNKDASLGYYSRIEGISTEFVQKYNDQGQKISRSGGAWNFVDGRYDYSAFYGSGIEQSKNIKITLDNPAISDAIIWKASLPVTVFYQ